MRLVRYNPFSELSFFGNFPDPSDRFFHDPIFKSRNHESWHPAVDIMEDGRNIILNVELPGMNKEDISVHIEDKILTIKGERKCENEEKNDRYYKKELIYGSFSRAFNLSDDILVDDVSADYKDGILKITLKRDETKETVKKITIH